MAWVLAALPLAFVAARMPSRVLRRLGLPLLVVSVALLVLTYVPGLGMSVSGNQNWIEFGGPFRIQPSELAKLGLVLWGGNGASPARASCCGSGGTCSCRSSRSPRLWWR